MTPPLANALSTGCPNVFWKAATAPVEVARAVRATTAARKGVFMV
jgi:hypothetical protein